MEKVTKEYEVYEFDELSEGAKEKALQQLSDINIDDNNWWLYDDCFRDLLMDAGLELGDGWAYKMYFDLDRGAYVFFDKGVLSIDVNKFFGKRSAFPKSVNKYIYASVDTRHYGGGSGKNVIDITIDDQKIADKWLDRVEEVGQSILDEVMDNLWKMLRDEYSWRTSREAVIDTIRGNEYKFLKNGKLFSE